MQSLKTVMISLPVAQRIEVKSAMGRVRCHNFSLEQLRPPLGTTILVASLFVERAAGGDTVFDLVERLRLRVLEYHNSLCDVDQVVGATLGSGWRQASEFRFDSELAEDTLRFFEAAVIPCINLRPPPEVTEVHFKSDLSRTPAADLAVRALEGGLFRAIHHTASFVAMSSFAPKYGERVPASKASSRAKSAIKRSMTKPEIVLMSALRSVGIR